MLQSRIDNAVPTPRWVMAITLCGAFLMGTGAIIALVNPAMLVGPGDVINAATKVYAGYLVSRNLAIAVLLVAALVKFRAGLTSLMILTAMIQGIDGVMDAVEGRWTMTPVVIILTIAFLAGAWKVSRLGAPGLS